MGLIDLLTQFSFNPECRAKMLRHQDTRPGMDFDALVESGQFEEYQSWQSEPKFHGLDYIVSFIGDGAGRARFGVCIESRVTKLCRPMHALKTHRGSGEQMSLSITTISN